MLAEVGIGLAKKFVNFSLPNSVASSQLCSLITTYFLHVTPVASASLLPRLPFKRNCPALHLQISTGPSGDMHGF